MEINKFRLATLDSWETCVAFPFCRLTRSIRTDNLDFGLRLSVRQRIGSPLLYFLLRTYCLEAPTLLDVVRTVNAENVSAFETKRTRHCNSGFC